VRPGRVLSRSSPRGFGFPARVKQNPFCRTAA
jgi:hypothetical protein